MKALYTYLKLLYTNYKNQGIVSKVQLISLLQTSKTDLAMNFIDYERKKLWNLHYQLFTFEKMVYFTE